MLVFRKSRNRDVQFREGPVGSEGPDRSFDFFHRRPATLPLRDRYELANIPPGHCLRCAYPLPTFYRRLISPGAIQCQVGIAACNTVNRDPHRAVRLSMPSAWVDLPRASK